jgi:hypothetical protein
LTSKENQCIQAAYDFRMDHTRGKIEVLLLLVGRYIRKLMPAPPPETKTVLALWGLHGIDQNRHGEHRAVWLLNQWLNTLYGEGTADRLDIEGRCREKGQRNIRMNLSSYKGDENAPHFYFGNPFDNVLESITAELPHYV